MTEHFPCFKVCNLQSTLKRFSKSNNRFSNPVTCILYLCSTNTRTKILAKTRLKVMFLTSLTCPCGVCMDYDAHPDSNEQLSSELRVSGRH